MSDPQHAAPARPEPVMKAARQAQAVAGLVALITTALGTYGAATGQQWAIAASAIVAAITTGLAGTMPSITASGARAQVTPVADPRAMDGSPLVAEFKVSGADYSPSMSAE